MLAYLYNLWLCILISFFFFKEKLYLLSDILNRNLSFNGFFKAGFIDQLYCSFVHDDVFLILFISFIVNVLILGLFSFSCISDCMWHSHSGFLLNMFNKHSRLQVSLWLQLGCILLFLIYSVLIDIYNLCCFDFFPQPQLIEVGLRMYQMGRFISLCSLD